MARKKKEVEEVAEDKPRDLSKDIAALNKKFKNSTIRKFSEHENIPKEDIISTGSIALDYCLGKGGLVKGRIYEIFGAESSGKTTAMLQAVASCQKQGGLVAFIDLEGTLTPERALKFGIDVDSLILADPDSGEEAFEIIKYLAEGLQVDLIIVDSVPYMQTKKTVDASMEDQHIAPIPRMMGNCLPKVKDPLKDNKTCLVFINQTRDNIGVTFGDKIMTPGGKAIKFACTGRLHINQGKKIISKEKSLLGDEEPIGVHINIRNVKNKLGDPFKKASFPIFFETGVDKELEILTFGKTLGLIDLNGAFYSIPHGKESIKKQGEGQATAYLRENPELTQELETKIRDILFNGGKDIETELPSQ